MAQDERDTMRGWHDTSTARHEHGTKRAWQDEHGTRRAWHKTSVAQEYTADDDSDDDSDESDDD